MDEARLEKAAARTRQAGLLAGPAIFLLLLLLPAPEGMTPAGWRTAAMAGWMAIWWITEAIPIAATALLPLAAFPLLGIATITATASPYANPVIFLFMGGFILATAFERWGLHRRVALAVLRGLGTRPANVVGGFMLATGAISMWVSNTATAVMMLPIALSVIPLLRTSAEKESPSDRNFKRCLALGIAYASSIGGLGTLIGTPPNALFAGFMEESYGVQIGFARWMTIGVPLVAVTLPLAWLVLTRLIYPVGREEIPGGAALFERQRQELGPISRPALAVATVTSLVAAAWVLRPLLEGLVPGISDAGIAVVGALLLFALPAGGSTGESLLDWEHAARLPWDVLILFGGGLSLAAAISGSGLAEWIGAALGGLEAWPAVAVTLAVTTVVIFLTELTSNTATAAAFLPVAGSVAVGMGVDPLLLAIPATLAASCGFMFPVGTPPNAIVYGTGLVSMREMARAGFLLNLLFVGAITLLTYTLVIAVFGITL